MGLLNHQRLQLFVLILLCREVISATLWNKFTKAPRITPPIDINQPVFGNDEIRYERYAAALAATEPIRKLRDRKAKQSLLPLEFWLLKRRGVLSGGKGICDLAKVDPLNKNEDLTTICNQHVVSMTAIIKAFGLTVSEFNNLSKEVSNDIELRKRVMKQAYHYRLSTDLSPCDSYGEEEKEENKDSSSYTTTKIGNRNTSPSSSLYNSESSSSLNSNVIQKSVKSPPLSWRQSKSLKRSINHKVDANELVVVNEPIDVFRDGGSGTDSVGITILNRFGINFLGSKNSSVPRRKLTVTRFANLLDSVEKLRNKMENDVKEELNIKVLPSGIYHPTFFPMLSPKVKRIYNSFPKVAAELVQAEGVSVSEFNGMMVAFKKNPLTRFRVNRRLRMLVKA